jgi:hypothetical protein
MRGGSPLSSRSILLAGAVGAVVLVPDLAHAAEPAPVRHTAADEFAGFAGSGFLGWTQNSLRRPNHYDLFLRDPGGSRLRVNRPGTEGFGGGIEGATVVYEEVVWPTRRLVLYDALGGGYTELPVVSRKGSYSHPTISGVWILYTSGRRDRTTSVRLYNRVTGETRRLARIRARGRQRHVYSGQIAGDWAVWSRRLPARQDVFLTNTSTRETVRIPRPPGVQYQYAPAVTATGTVFFARDRPCARPCSRREARAVKAQLLEVPLGGRARVVVTLRRHLDFGFMFAAQEDRQIKLLYALYPTYPLLPPAYPFGNIFAITVPSPND